MVHTRTDDVILLVGAERVAAREEVMRVVAVDPHQLTQAVRQARLTSHNGHQINDST